jgi:hypothetical protein
MTRKLLAVAAIGSFGLAGLGLGYLWARQSPGQFLNLAATVSAAGKDDVPAYHANPPSEPLPETVDAQQFPETVNQNAYALAAKVKAVLYQQPCYCRCDRNVGHKSLLDCFRDRHGSMCDVCKKEAVYSYEQTRRGKSPAEIRAAIIKGEWKSVDLSKYSAPLSSK